MTKELIVLAGTTGNLGERIAQNLTRQQVRVRALVRPGNDLAKLEKLKCMGAELKEVDWNSPSSLFESVEGGTCIISALSGLRPVIIGAQTKLLEAAVKAKVPRFFPSIILS